MFGKAKSWHGDHPQQGARDQLLQERNKRTRNNKNGNIKSTGLDSLFLLEDVITQKMRHILR